MKERIVHPLPIHLRIDGCPKQRELWVLGRPNHRRDFREEQTVREMQTREMAMALNVTLGVSGSGGGLPPYRKLSQKCSVVSVVVV